LANKPYRKAAGVEFQTGVTMCKLRWLCLIAVLLVTGCQSQEQPEPPANSSLVLMREESINDYLATHIGITSRGGEVYCAYDLLDAGRATQGKLYIWALCLEYDVEHGSLTTGSGISLPVALQIQENNDHYEIIGHLVPGDGEYYGPDVRSIFPRSTWPQIMPENEAEINQYNSRANELMQDTLMQARLSNSIED
jgi:hypothetical protein